MIEKIKLFYDLDVVKVNEYYYKDGIYYKYEKVDNLDFSIINNVPGLNKIILNKKNEYISDGYCLIKCNYFIDDVVDIKELLNKNIIKKQKNNWIELWKDNVDYLERLVHDKGFDRKIVLSSFTYFVGMAENAIRLINKINISDLVCVSRRRVYYPNLSNDYYDPLNIIFDSRVRDVSEYLKFKFFSGFDIYDDIDYVLKNINYDEMKLLFTRMLYPTYYFDLLINILNGDEENKILSIIDKINDYEVVLSYLNKKISSVTDLDIIDWLKKE